MMVRTPYNVDLFHFLSFALRHSEMTKEEKVAIVPSHIWSSGEEAILYDIDPEQEERSNGEGEEKISKAGGFITSDNGGRITEIVAEKAVATVARVVLSTGTGLPEI